MCFIFRNVSKCAFLIRGMLFCEKKTGTRAVNAYIANDVVFPPFQKINVYIYGISVIEYLVYAIKEGTITKSAICHMVQCRTF